MYVAPLVTKSGRKPFSPYPISPNLRVKSCQLSSQGGTEYPTHSFLQGGTFPDVVLGNRKYCIAPLPPHPSPVPPHSPHHPQDWQQSLKTVEAAKDKEEGLKARAKGKRGGDAGKGNNSSLYYEEEVWQLLLYWFLF